MKTKPALAILSLSALLVGLPVGGSATARGADPTSQGGTEGAPRITAARLRGKRLIVVGVDFDAGSVILVNGQRQNTEADTDRPDTVLIARRAGRIIGKTEVVYLRVQNSDGALSDEFGFFGGRIITRNDRDQPIKLMVGERFLLALSPGSSFYEWRYEFSDQSAFSPLPMPRPAVGVQGFFEAVKSGPFKLEAIGDPYCYRLPNPCRAPSLYAEIAIVVW